MTYIVDDRFRGAHGIGRYSSEILSRLPASEIRFRHGWTHPGSVSSLFDRGLAKGAVAGYSPGYLPFLTSRRVPQYLTIHDLIHLGDRRRRLAYSRMVRPCILRAGRVFTVSEESKMALQSWLGSGVEVVNSGNGVSSQFFNSRPVEREAGHFLIVGNLRPHKNLKPAVAALSRLPNARLSLVVPRGDLPNAQRMLIEDGVVGQVYSGVSDRELASLYRRCEALVFPSVFEGFGLPVAEAMVCGAPVVYYGGCDAVASIVNDSANAVSSHASSEAWAAALKDVRPLSAAQLESVARFSWDVVADVVWSALQRWTRGAAE